MVPVASSVTIAGTFAAAPAARRVKVVGMIEAAFMGLLNVAVTVVLAGTPVALGVGDWAITVGAASVVKLHTESAPSAVPAASVTVPATVAVYMVPAASGVVGVRVAMVPVASSVTVAATNVPATVTLDATGTIATRRLKLAVVIVAAF